MIRAACLLGELRPPTHVGRGARSTGLSEVLHRPAVWLGQTGRHLTLDSSFLVHERKTR